MYEVGLYAQDQWKVGRLSLNYGLRYEYINQSAPAVDIPASVLTDERAFPAIDYIPNWHDVNPRMAVSYDLFGDGKTALKASLGGYSERKRSKLRGCSSRRPRRSTARPGPGRTRTATSSPTATCDPAKPGASGRVWGDGGQ